MAVFKCRVFQRKKEKRMRERERERERGDILDMSYQRVFKTK
jgi:hypothetical protein